MMQKLTQEEKDLLLKDICARLPYGVKIYVNNKVDHLDGIDILDNVASYGSFLSIDIEDVKPYLRPMSSMTDEEFKEYEKENDIDTADSSETLRENLKAKKRVRVSKWYRGSDWLNKNHFDYRGLIPMGLAIDATGKNIY